MKIAILTQPICNNYGGILQNYALQTLLEREGNEVITLNFPVAYGYSSNSFRHILSICKRTLFKIMGHPEIVWIDLAIESRKRVELSHLQKAFIDKYLHLHTIVPPITKQQIIDFHFDAYIVGSDQVWRPRYNSFIENMFLDFVEGQDVKRFTYAASFGVDKWEYTPEQTERCARLASYFDAISVRENSGVELCLEYLKVKATHVIDPTIMLPVEDYLSLCSGNEHPTGDYIAVYTLDYTKQQMVLLNEISCKLKTPLYFIGRFTKNGYPSVESWLEGIANAKYVITDSFHGTVFSIIFNRQFVTLGNEVRGNSRFNSLFDSLGIPRNRQSNNSTDIIRILHTPLDYNEINLLKKKCRKVALDFLDVLYK